MKVAREIMNKKVITFSPNDSIFNVAKVFSKKDISGAPIVKRNKIVGMITLADIIRFIDLKLSNLPTMYVPGLTSLLLMFIQMEKINIDFKKEMKKITRIKIKDVMKTRIVTVKPEATILEVAEIMDRNNVHRVPVVENRKIVGIIARSDVIKGLIL